MHDFFDPTVGRKQCLYSSLITGLDQLVPSLSMHRLTTASDCIGNSQEAVILWNYVAQRTDGMIRDVSANMILWLKNCKYQL